MNTKIEKDFYKFNIDKILLCDLLNDYIINNIDTDSLSNNLLIDNKLLSNNIITYLKKNDNFKYEMINTDIIPVENFIFSGAKVLKVVTKIGKILIEKTWYNKFQNIFDNLINSDIFDNLLKYGNILPASEIIFNWTFFTDPNSLEIIYLCQEGYTDLKYNIGVGFCIPSNLKYNNLLQNFYKKMLLQVPKVKNENLTIDEWVKKGNLFRYCKKMLFLNSSLTFSNQPSFESHLKFWRKKFIEPFLIENKDKIIVTLGKKSSEIMISLQKKHNFKKIINDDHPSSRQLNNNYFDNPKIFFEEYF